MTYFWRFDKRILLTPEVKDVLTEHLGPDKVRLLEIYCSGGGRLSLKKAAEWAGWSAPSGWRILRRARELLGTDEILSGPEQRRVRILRIHREITRRRGRNTEDGERAALTASIVGCSPRTVYRRLGQAG